MRDLELGGKFSLSSALVFIMKCCFVLLDGKCMSAGRAKKL